MSGGQKQRPGGLFSLIRTQLMGFALLDELGKYAILTSETEQRVECGLLLDVLVAEGATVLEIFSSEDESLLIWRNSFLFLNLGHARVCL